MIRKFLMTIRMHVFDGDEMHEAQILRRKRGVPSVLQYGCRNMSTRQRLLTRHIDRPGSALRFYPIARLGWRFVDHATMLPDAQTRQRSRNHCTCLHRIVHLVRGIVHRHAGDAVIVQITEKHRLIDDSDGDQATLGNW